jgi:hypothetical protein
MNVYEPDGLRAKALEHWAGAQSEQAAGRFSTAMALAYYACFQTVLAMHVERGGQPDHRDRYSHFLIYQSARTFLEEMGRGDLVDRLPLIHSARRQAQYTSIDHSETDCASIMRSAGAVLEALGGLAQ